jgi:hypothetical protein
MRVAIADPPYPGQSKRLYGDHEAYAGEVDHRELVARLMGDYEAWALHTSASALHAVLPLCPAPVMDTKKNKGRYLNGTGTRILVWVKTMAPWRPVDIQWSCGAAVRAQPRGRRRCPGRRAARSAAAKTLKDQSTLGGPASWMCSGKSVETGRPPRNVSTGGVQYVGQLEDVR